MVNDQLQVRDSLSQHGHILQVVRENANHLKDRAILRQDFERLDHCVLHHPVRVGFIVNQVSDAAKLGVLRIHFEPFAGGIGVQQVYPANHRANPGVGIGVAQHGRGIFV